ncbi:uncharacterized protein LOC112590724 [Harpegnathos saltator]|uniref:uncharacterized protein LOC112590724 n=1 Tax=Harpegnathos saltator TaxID=610380 RepID=UPI000DBED264|nr:uncharacterized protein LOC112590724 [Harpegnathos saltator]
MQSPLAHWNWSRVHPRTRVDCTSTGGAIWRSLLARWFGWMQTPQPEDPVRAKQNRLGDPAELAGAVVRVDADAATGGSGSGQAESARRYAQRHFYIAFLDLSLSSLVMLPSA